ncbi:unnamed protein product [marine sediment metagenome]|uniref:Uncharacterized protein n=1 Tax=marine sediment metagenome TaxID=412755 RepID=X1MAK6_9ZZZZ
MYGGGGEEKNELFFKGVNKLPVKSISIFKVMRLIYNYHIIVYSGDNLGVSF